MAKDKKSFIAYCDWKETFDSLPDDKAGQLIKHILSYVNDENPKTDDILINAVFANIKQTLKRDLIKYEKYLKKQSENGKKGGRPKKTETQINPEKGLGFLDNPTKPKKADSVSVSDSDILNKFNNTDQEPLFMQLGIHPDLIEKYKNEFKGKVLARGQEYTQQDLNTWWYNWLKKQPKRDFKYLTDQEKERRQVPKEWDYIFWNDTYKRLKQDNKGYYVEHLNKRYDL